MSRKAVSSSSTALNTDYRHTRRSETSQERKQRTCAEGLEKRGTLTNLERKKVFDKYLHIDEINDRRGKGETGLPKITRKSCRNMLGKSHIRQMICKLELEGQEGALLVISFSLSYIYRSFARFCTRVIKRGVHGHRSPNRHQWNFFCLTERPRLDVNSSTGGGASAAASAASVLVRLPFLLRSADSAARSMRSLVSTFLLNPSTCASISAFLVVASS
jgi:hypothetical protein